MAKNIDSIKHNNENRVHIPSREEAGYEDANPKVQAENKTFEIPKNPVVHRGQDPELFWLNKYDNDDREDNLSIDIRSLYRHEHIAPETLIEKLYSIKETESDQLGMFSVSELFGNSLDKDELEKISEYYKHNDSWTNRLIQGDSLMVMTSLLEREGMAGQVQTVYIDPPYGIKYGGNWQIHMSNRDVKDGNDDSLTGEPEQIKAFRDTWELGIHSYLSYMRDRLIIAKELLNESGSCFVQISDENVHLIRSLMDEVFGSENFVSQISFAKTASIKSNFLSSTYDYLIWYGKDKSILKYRQLFLDRIERTEGGTYNCLEFPDGSWRRATKDELLGIIPLPKNSKKFRAADISRQGESSNPQPYKFEDKIYYPSKGRHWAARCPEGLDLLVKNNRIVSLGKVLSYKLFEDDFPLSKLENVWNDTILGTFSKKAYVVQTSSLPIQRCILMTTDPGDIVLDPTCGSGTTAFVAEQWGRRWITIDTSRIALNIAKQRITTAVYPFYKLYDEKNEDIRQGFVYKEVPHITLKSIAYDEPPSTETLFEQPETDKKKLRVSGPFTVETLQSFEPVSPEELENNIRQNEEEGAFEEIIKQHLLSSGVKNGRKDEHVIFSRVELLGHEYLNAEGFYQTEKGESKAYFYIGPKFGTVSKNSVNNAVRECRARGDADWLVILGFSFESDIEGSVQTTSLGNFEVTKARIHDDLLQEGLKKKPAKSAASFVTIGEPDIILHKENDTATVEIKGLDIYDPIKDEVKARNLNDIAYWMVDDDYDGSNFIVRQVFFCGGKKDEFSKWKKGLNDAAKQGTRRNVERTLKIEIDEDAFERLYGFESHPIRIYKKNQKIALRMISQYGEESTKVLSLD